MILATYMYMKYFLIVNNGDCWFRTYYNGDYDTHSGDIIMVTTILTVETL